MKLKKYLSALVLVLIPILSFCEAKYENADGCTWHYTTDDSYGEIKFPKDLKCISLSTNQTYITSNTSVNVTRKSYNVYAYRPSGWGRDVLGYDLNEKLYFFVQILPNGTEEGPFEYDQFKDKRGNKTDFFNGRDRCEEKSRDWPINATTQTVTYEGLDQSYFNIKTKKLSQLGASSINIRFQVVSWINVLRGTDNSRYDKEKTIAGNSANITFYVCDAGKIGLSKMTPKIEDNGTDNYCVYPKPLRSSNDYVMQITNMQSPGYYDRDLYFSWNLYNHDKSHVSHCYRPVPLSSGEYTLATFANFKYSDFGDYKVGDRYTLTRSINFTNEYKNELDCSTPALTFEIVPEAFLSDKGVNSESVCPKNDKMKINDNKKYQDSDWSNLKGEEIKFRDSDNRIVSSMSDAMKDAYGIKYGWEYSLDKENWITLLDTIGTEIEIHPNGDYNYTRNFLSVSSLKEYDLLIPNNMFADGKTRYFRQVVTLTKFSNRKIVSEKLYELKPYRIINESDFKVNPLGSLCADGNTHEVELSVSFNRADSPEALAEYKPASDNGVFQYNCSFLGQKEKYNDINLNATYNVNADEVVKYDAKITVTDGCGTEVELQDSMMFEPQPVLNPASITCTNAEYSVVDGSVHINIPSGTRGFIKIVNTDPNFAKSKYFYSTDNKTFEEISSHGLEVILTNEGEKTFYIKKQSNYGNKCESQSVEVSVSRIRSIGNNKINDSIYYVCNKKGNPKITASTPNGGFGGTDYTYSWLYSNDNVTYSVMKKRNLDLITTQDLEESEWRDVIDRKYYFKRVVTSTSGNGTLSDTSAAVVVMPYNDPIITLMPDSNYVCYGTEVGLSTILDAEFKTQVENGKKTMDFWYAVKNAKDDFEPVSPKQENVSSPSIYNITIKKDMVLYAMVDVCGKTYNSDGKKITSGDNLEPDIIIGDCRVRGGKMKVNVANANPKYTYHINGIEADAAEIDVPVKTGDDLIYTVKVDDGKCSKIYKNKVDESKLQDAFVHSTITVGGTETAMICAGVENTFKSANVNASTTDYLWKDGVNTIEGSNSPSLNYTLVKPGYEYTLIRLSKQMAKTEVCQSIYDTLKISTFPEVERASISVDKSIVCHNDSVTLTINGFGGASNSIYSFTIFKDGSEIITDKASSLDEKKYAIRLGSNGIHEIDAIVSDAQGCSNNSNYQKKTATVAVTQAASAEFSLTATPSIWIPGKEDTEKTFSITATASNVKDDMSEDLFIHNYGDNPVAKSTGETFSIIAQTTDFVDGNLIVKVTRVVDGTGCSANNKVSISLSSGFTDRPSIMSTAFADADKVEVCGGETVTLSLKEIPMFGEDVIKESSLLSYTWYKNQQLQASTPTYKAVAIAGDTAVYQCKLSYKDSKMSQASSVYSYDFTLIGKMGVRIGNIYKSDDKSRFAYTCLGSDKNITLEVDADFETGDKIIWEQSEDGISWIEINEKNVVDNSVTRLTLNGASYSSKAGKTYFRVKGVSACNTETYSKNIVTLTVQLLPDAPVVALRSRNVIEKGSDVSLAFSPKNNYAGFKYAWGTTEDDLGNTTDNATEAILTSKFNIGENKIYVKKIATTDGMCESELITYDFKLYEALSIGNLFGDNVVEKRCGNHDKVSLVVNDIFGGSGNYVINWQYKKKDENWVSFDENSKLDFSTTFVEGLSLFGDTYQFSLRLTGLSSTITFRAKIASKDENGDNIGSPLVTNEYTLTYYDALQDNGIDTEEKTLCYGGVLYNISGSQPKGGDQKYIYQWYKTNTPTEPSSWVTIPSATSQNYAERDTLFKTTYYKRVVSDGCGSRVEPMLYKHVIVKDAVFIADDDIGYYDVVSDGEPSVMWGKPKSNVDASQYVWFNEDWQVLDTTVVSKKYSTDKLYAEDKDLKDYIYYAKKLDGVCLSYNSDTLFITAYKNTSGTIFVNGTDTKNEDKYWVCSGTTDVEIKSESNPMNVLSYLWYYSLIEYDGEDSKTVSKPDLIRTMSGAAAMGEEINLDTCAINAMGKSKMINESGYKMALEIYRLAKFEVNASSMSLESNKIRINIVPTMVSANKVLRKALVGSIHAENINYCKGDEADIISGEEDFGSDTWNIWSDPSSNFGPWLYDEDYDEEGVTTWWETKNANEEDYEKRSPFKLMKGYAQYLSLGELNVNSSVRRAIYDGCTSAYTNTLTLYVADEVASIDNIEMYAYETGKTSKYDKIYKGFEFGDSLVIGDKNSSNVIAWNWSLDSMYTEVIEESKSYVGFWIDENYAINLMQDPNIYLKRKSRDCWSSSLQIPIALGTASNGGLISKTQKVCFGADFKGINNIEEASGEWIAPKRAEMKWSYGWQWSQDSVKWVNIENSDNISLSADLVNKYVDPLKLMSGKTTYFRRVATNDSARVRYSNVAVLSYYDEMKPGVLNDDQDGKTGYCAGDDLPVISTTLPTGGTFEENGVSYTWKLSIDGGEYVELPTKKTTLDLAFVDTIYNQTLDKNVEVSVVCEYSDGKIGCGTVESEPLNYVLYRRNDAPGIYQDNDSCDANTVVVKVVPEKIEKTYIFGTFVETENGDSLTWESVANEKTIQRVTTMIVDEYGVYSVDKETGCHSEYTKFNVDSLPDLNQGVLEAPLAVCYGEDYTVKGGVVVGGNGTKTFTWQYSYDEVEWETLSNQSEEDLDVIKPKYGISYRRIVSDMCGVDTSNIVHIEVREKIDVTKEVLVFNDFKCANRKFNINTAEGVVFTDNDYYLVWNSATGETFDTKNMTFRTVDEFEGDSLEMRMTHAVVDTTGMICKSEEIVVYAHHSIALDPEANHISCENITPCNGRYVEIEGESQGGAFADKISYKWYVSHDSQTWMEDFKTGKDLSLLAEDTMFVRRIASNGCESDTSNIVTIFGTKVERYDYVGRMMLNIVSNMQDSSVAMTIERGKEFAADYYFEGDGILPVVSENTTILPYKTDVYKDSILMLVANMDHCVSAYRFNPLRGGIIRFDGDSVLCGNSDIPAIVSTIVEGGNGNYTYQWQYKNIYTVDYVNVEGATNNEYTPKPVSVETSYRRLTMDGEYTSVSNVIKVNIRPLPKTTDIVPSVSDSVLNLYSLKKTQYSVEKLPSLELNLIDTISDADIVTWQKSYDNIKWEDVESLEANESGVYTMAVVDTIESVYYRTVATSTCGEHTSKAYKVTTLYASFIMDEELVLRDSACAGVEELSINFKKDYPDVYEYSYRTIDFEGEGVRAFGDAQGSGYASLNGSDLYLTDSTKVSYGAAFFKPKHSFDVEITRWVKKTGARSTKLVHFYVNDLSAKFNYIVDGVETHESGEKKNTVRLNQGSRVVFTPEITGGLENKNYKWNLIAPLNVNYYERYGGNVGRDGLTSEKESPVCYFYNEGAYTIKMQVSDGMCTSTISDTAMYIGGSGSLRSYSVSASFEDEAFDYVKLNGTELGYVEVYPTHFSDVINIFTDLEDEQHYEIYNTLGKKVAEGSYTRSVEINTIDFPSGAYILNTAGHVERVMKTE